MKTFLIFVIFCWVGSASGAEEKPVESKQPKTKLEAFEAQIGAVIIRGFSKIGVVRGQYGTSAEVESKEFTDASSGKKAYGVSITVKETSRLEREHSSYIDYDEIESLIKGIEYITKIEKSVTKLDDFQADFRTKGEIMVSTFSDKAGRTQAAIQSGRFGSTSAYLSLSDLAKFKVLIEEAKGKLDSIRQ